MAASIRAEQLLAAALRHQDVPPAHSNENENIMNNSANKNASATADALDAAADNLRATEADLQRARQEELDRLTSLRDSTNARILELQGENKNAANLLAGAAEPSMGRTVLKYMTVTAAAVGVGALGLWAYGRFSGRGVEEVVQSAGEAVASAGDAIANAA